MSTRSRSIPPQRKLRERMLAFCLSLLSVLLALPATAAIDIPTDPLTTGARVPPNILFILDDSGSMEWTYMPDNAPSATWQRQAYTLNTIYYDPRIRYEPWLDSNGTPMSGGASYSAVYSSSIAASGVTTDLKSAIQTFYVPKPASTDLNVQTSYWRYQIHTDGVVIRSDYGPRLGSSSPYNRGLDGRGCSANTGNGWRNCAELTPTGRSNEAERENFALWYSYHRTRNKVAKAGAGRAFSELGSNVRVGFRSIHGRGLSGNPITNAKPIPVSRNGGLFVDPNGPSGADNNRTAWYERLYGATASDSTPLREALYRAGTYFESDLDANGPWGPGTGSGQYACRQNFSILTTDGYRNDGGWQSLAEVDNIAGPVIGSPSGATYQYQPGPPYASSHSGNLADIAMHFWSRDLRSDLDNIVPWSVANPAFWQHMVTFGISLGAPGTLNPQRDLAALTSGAQQWPFHYGYNSGSNGGAESIDDLWHAAVNGRGQFVLANNPTEFASALKTTLTSITDRAGSFSNVAANSTSLDTGARVFQASYVSGAWTGNLVSRRVTVNGVSTDTEWRASQGIPATNRRIFTRHGLFPANATEGQLALLARVGASNHPVDGADNAAYIAGNQSLELNQSNGRLRTRSQLLGDIVSSSPAYVAETETVYVGANDGMLHAFSAADGNELFAFIPDGVNWSWLGEISRPDYTHRYFVDGPVVTSTRQQTSDRTLLVGTLGKGGKGLFALDVTEPESFDQSDILWQAYETPGNNMGLIQGEPVIARLPDGIGGSFLGLIVGNGVNSTNNRAVLLIYNLQTGALVREISTGVGSASESNGLSAPVGWDANGDGIVDSIYAGDMLGNVWKFSVGGNEASWSVANSGSPMFQTATGQPISGRVTVGMHPANFSTWIFFGTGRFITVDDVTNQSTQGLYGIRDDDVVVSRSDLIQRSTVVAGNSNGRPVRSFQGHTPLPLKTEDDRKVRGWYISLLEPPNQTAIGERIVTEVQVINRVLVAASIIPTYDACQPDGRGYLNALDAFTGTSLKDGSFFDLDGDGDFNDETLVSDSDELPVGSVDLGVGMPTLPNLLRELAVVGGSSGGTGSVRIRDNRASGRVSWREVVME